MIDAGRFFFPYRVLLFVCGCFTGFDLIFHSIACVWLILYILFVSVFVFYFYLKTRKTRVGCTSDTRESLSYCVCVCVSHWFFFLSCCL